MPGLTIRSLIKMGNGGLVISIPKSWADYYNLKGGDKVEVVADGVLRVRPMRPMRPKRKSQSQPK